MLNHGDGNVLLEWVDKYQMRDSRWCSVNAPSGSLPNSTYQRPHYSVGSCCLTMPIRTLMEMVFAVVIVGEGGSWAEQPPSWERPLHWAPTGWLGVGHTQHPEHLGGSASIFALHRMGCGGSGSSGMLMLMETQLADSVAGSMGSPTPAVSRALQRCKRQ